MKLLIFTFLVIVVYRAMTASIFGEPLKPQYTLGFEYSDCWAEDARLVVLNARDAADKGAVIAPPVPNHAPRYYAQALWAFALALIGLWLLTGAGLTFNPGDLVSLLCAVAFSLSIIAASL